MDPTKKKDTHIQGQRRSPNKTVGGVKWHLELNPTPTKEASRAQTKPCVHQNPGTPQEAEPDLPLSVCLLWRHGWAACPLLWGQVLWLKQTWEAWQLSPTIKPPSRHPTNWRAITLKKFSHCCESSRAHKTVPNLGIWQTDWESQGIWLWRPVGFDYRTYTGLRKQILGGHTQNLVCTRTQKKGAVIPQETKPDLSVSVQESSMEAWVDSDMPWGQGH